MDTPNSRKRSPRDSAKSRQQTTAAPQDRSYNDAEDEQHVDRSMDHVARVRAAKEAAQRLMEEFGDPSEYDVTILQGKLKREPGAKDRQPSLDFEREGENR